MYFKQFYLACLAQASYLIGSEGEAVVVDPRRDVAIYIDEAKANNLTIKYIIETHLHADFVSGHAELSSKTGAQIIFGEQSKASGPTKLVKDNDEIRIGSVILRFLETPGHTPESISIIIIETKVSNEPQKLLTGDTLFIGDVGRPDLAGDVGYSAEQMASFLYDSLHNKILTLDDSVEVWPAHGAGSLCGKNLSVETSSTIGQQRKSNYATQPMSKEDFIKMLTEDLPDVPAYFPFSVQANRTGALSLAEIKEAISLSPSQVKDLVNDKEYIIVDVRSSAQFGAGHIPGALHIPIDGQFAMTAGALVNRDKKIVLITDDQSEVKTVVMRLARVGLENTYGFLDGGMFSWLQAGFDMNQTDQFNVRDVTTVVGNGEKTVVVDCRTKTEFKNGHVPAAKLFPLGSLESDIDSGKLDDLKNSKLLLFCRTGYRSTIATSILERKGWANENIGNIVGGYVAWTASGLPVENVKCCSSGK